MDGKIRISFFCDIKIFFFPEKGLIKAHIRKLLYLFPIFLKQLNHKRLFFQENSSFFYFYYINKYEWEFWETKYILRKSNWWKNINRFFFSRYQNWFRMISSNLLCLKNENIHQTFMIESVEVVCLNFCYFYE